MTRTVPFVIALVLAAGIALSASGPLGIYAIVERVVFEPNEQAPERIQIFGAFAYVNGGAADRGLEISRAARGYMYFKVRSAFPGITSDAYADVVKREWNDIKSVAGTGQAIGFGRWGYIAGFSALQPDAPPVAPSFLWERKPQGGESADLRVRPATEKPENPATYQTDSGVVKIPDQGSHAAIVQQLRAALKTR